jgi:hypothetical protein
MAIDFAVSLSISASSCCESGQFTTNATGAKKDHGETVCTLNVRADVIAPLATDGAMVVSGGQTHLNLGVDGCVLRRPRLLFEEDAAMSPPPPNEF